MTAKHKEDKANKQRNALWTKYEGEKLTLFLGKLKQSLFPTFFYFPLTQQSLAGKICHVKSILLLLCIFCDSKVSKFPQGVGVLPILKMWHSIG